MKKLSFLAFAAIVMMGVAFASCDSTKSVSLKSEIDSVSYLLGTYHGYGVRESMKQMPGGSENPINMDILIKGFTTAAKGDSVYLGKNMNEVMTYLNSYFQNAQMKESEANNAEVNKFLAENAKQSGVITTESGLQYKVITEGTGPKPTLTDEIKMHFHGTKLNGEVFQSSQGGEPIQLAVNGVIPGLTEGLQLMPVGSKYIFWIKQELAYGAAGGGHQLSGQFLIFEIELLEIVKK